MITVLLLTFFLQGGLVQPVTLIAPDMEQCLSNAPYLVKAGLSIPMEIAGKKYQVEYVDAFCHEVERGSVAAK